MDCPTLLFFVTVLSSSLAKRIREWLSIVHRASIYPKKSTHIYVLVLRTRTRSIHPISLCLSLPLLFGSSPPHQT